MILKPDTHRNEQDCSHSAKIRGQTKVGSLWQACVQPVANRDPMRIKTDLPHKGREGYIRMLDFLVVT